MKAPPVVSPNQRGFFTAFIYLSSDSPAILPSACPQQNPTLLLIPELMTFSPLHSILHRSPLASAKASMSRLNSCIRSLFSLPLVSNFFPVLQLTILTTK